MSSRSVDFYYASPMSIYWILEVNESLLLSINTGTNFWLDFESREFLNLNFLSQLAIDAGVVMVL